MLQRHWKTLHVRHGNGFQRCGHMFKGIGMSCICVAMHSKAWKCLTCKAWPCVYKAWKWVCEGVATHCQGAGSTWKWAASLLAMPGHTFRTHGHAFKGMGMGHIGMTMYSKVWEWVMKVWPCIQSCGNGIGNFMNFPQCPFKGSVHFHNYHLRR